MDRWLADRGGLIAPGVAQRARLVARLLGGSKVSGERLAGELGVSRAAVHKHVDALRSAGFKLRSAPGSGYVLSDPSDMVAPEALLPYLASSSTALGTPLVYEPTMPSTNARAREAGREGAPHGMVVLTDHQNAGKGRLGRVWVSGPGEDLTFSVLLRPEAAPESAARFTLAASTAVADAVSALGDLGGGVRIKWPNDVLVDGHKVCGILSEASLDMDRLHWLVVGIGLNVNGSPAARVPAAELAPGGPAPTSLSERLGHPVPRAPLLVGLLERLEARFAEAAGHGWADVLERFRGLDALDGEPVEVRFASRPEAEPFIGVARGLSPGGELRVEAADGTVREVFSGEVTLRRQP